MLVMLTSSQEMTKLCHTYKTKHTHTQLILLYFKCNLNKETKIIFVYFCSLRCIHSYTFTNTHTHMKRAQMCANQAHEHSISLCIAIFVYIVRKLIQQKVIVPPVDKMKEKKKKSLLRSQNKYKFKLSYTLGWIPRIIDKCKIKRKITNVCHKNQYTLH